MSEFLFSRLSKESHFGLSFERMFILIAINQNKCYGSQYQLMVHNISECYFISLSFPPAVNVQVIEHFLIKYPLIYIEKSTRKTVSYVVPTQVFHKSKFYPKHHFMFNCTAMLTILLTLLLHVVTQREAFAKYTTLFKIA